MNKNVLIIILKIFELFVTKHTRVSIVYFFY